MRVDRNGAVGPAPKHAGVQSGLDRGARVVDLARFGEPDNADVADRHRLIVQRRRGDGEMRLVDAQRQIAAGRGEEAPRRQFATQTDDGLAFARADHAALPCRAFSRR